MNEEINKDFFKTSSSKEFNSISTTEITQKLKEDAKKALAEKGLFIVKKISDWMNESKKRPTPKMLFSEFWFEGELCILFADTNVGKSILAVQIGNSIAIGKSIEGFILEAEKGNVLYLDFELSDKQFELRYSDNNNENHYHFSENFLRAEVNPESEIPKGTFEEYLHASLDRTIQETGSKILIVDNLTYLSNETEKAKDALPLMKQLKALKQKYKLSILVLAHTPKRDSHKPLTKNDLQGSKMLINFCDSAFAIGENHNENGGRYLKQIKTRNTEFIYDSKNVIVCRIEKPENFLKMTRLYFAEEFELLNSPETSFDKKRALAREMKKNGLTIDEISEKIDIGRSTVGKYTKDITSKNGRNKSTKKTDIKESDFL